MIPAIIRPQTGPVGFVSSQGSSRYIYLNPILSESKIAIFGHFEFMVVVLDSTFGDRTVKILSRFACHRSGVGPDPNWTSYMSNLAILGARNSVKRSVCGIEAPMRKLVFRKRTIEGLELVPDPPGDRQRHLKDSIVWCHYSVEYFENEGVACLSNIVISPSLLQTVQQRSHAAAQPLSGPPTDRRRLAELLRTSAGHLQLPTATRSPATKSPGKAIDAVLTHFGFLAAGDDSGHHSASNRSRWIRIVARIIKIYISQSYTIRIKNCHFWAFRVYGCCSRSDRWIVFLTTFLECIRKMEKFDIYIVWFGDRHENQDRTVKILSRFACHRSGVGPDPNWTSYMSNLAILGARNSVKRSVCGIESPVRKLVFRKRTIEGLELVPDPPGDR
ncbi:hypothetical protein PanWU01x14_019310 [Parasponia andersonii]|uniref:Uncharacterized protein n=1 Tax=Parasponia andersonii TaxID=3476 RepID=A0A2P5DZI5_PARAD|nr:hypothetical protein PanWU01x14_019310 [Parasponia andersonii]